MTGPLISAEALAASATRPTLLDVRWTLGGPPGLAEYETGHIPAAVFVNLDTELAGTPGSNGRHPLPARESFQAAMQAAGVQNKGPVVVYDGGSSMSAGRAWWLLRYYGHGDAAVLDGGLAAWVGAGYPVTTEPSRVERGDFVARPGAMPVLMAQDVPVLAARGALLDARAPERFTGEHEPIDPVAGHIPGAVNVPATTTLDSCGRLLERSALREIFERAGVGDGVEVGAYCGSGVTAAHEVLALELAGYEAALYPGSWSEWITDPRRQVVRGS
ncbi:MAG TPA: sulfurtransferase [Solirubrobacteraceae bacterium]|nr:sulfurtransferase [Solirubrobacteraceae bacterium]